MQPRFLVTMLVMALLLTLNTACGVLIPGGRQAQQAGPAAEEVEKAKANLADAEAKVETAEAGKKTAEQERDAKKAEADQANDNLAEAQATVQTLQGEIASGKVTKDDLKTQLGVANEGKTTADTNLTAKQTELDTANADLTAVQEKVKELQQKLDANPTAVEVASLKNDLAKAKTAKETAESKVTGLEKERDTAKTDLAKANARIAVLEGQVKSLQSGVPVDTAKLQTDLTKALTALETAKAELVEKQTELDKANAKVKTAEETIGELRKEIATLKQQLASTPKAGGNQTGAVVTPGAGQGSGAATGTGITPPSKPLADGSGKTGSCMITEQAQRLIGASVQRIGTEPCSWVIRTFPAKVKITMPTGFIGTLDLGDGNIVVTEKTGEYTIVAGTFRQRNAFPAWDPANNDNCGLLRKEQEFAASETPTFRVIPLGFTCDDGSSRLTPPAGSTPTASLSCPTTPQEAATLVGGKAENWRLLPKTEGLGWKYEGLNVTLKVPANSRLDHPAGSATTGEVTTTTATLWCSAGSKK